MKQQQTHKVDTKVHEASATNQQLPAEAASTAVGQVIDFASDAGAGMEGTDRDSFAIPFLAVIQANSPQMETIPGARAGMFFNTVTNELYEHPRIIPCAYQRRWVRWGAREVGGGFKGEYTPAEANALREKSEVKELDNRLYFPETDGSVNPKKSDRLSDTRNHFVLLVDGTACDFGTPAVLALASTAIKTSKNFMSRIDSKKVKTPDGRILPAPSFSGVYELSSVKKTNEKGSWYLPEVAPIGDVANTTLYAQAKAFHANVTAGKVQVAHETAQSPEAGGEGAGAGDEAF